MSDTRCPAWRELVGGEDRKPFVACRRIQRSEDLVEGHRDHALEHLDRFVVLEELLQRAHPEPSHGGVGVLEAGSIPEVDEPADAWGVVAEDLLHLFEGDPLLGDGTVGPDLDDRGRLVVTQRIGARGSEHRRAGESPAEGLQRYRAALAEQMTDDGAVRPRDVATRDLDVGFHAAARGGELKACSGAEPVGKLGDRLEAFDAQEAFELRERIEVLSARRAGRERAAGRQPVDSKACLELIEQEADLRLRPHADHPDPELSATARDPGCQEPLEIGALEVVEGQGVDHVLVRAVGCDFVHIQDQVSAPCALQAVLPEGA